MLSFHLGRRPALALLIGIGVGFAALTSFLAAFAALAILKVISWLHWLREPLFASTTPMITPDLLQTADPITATESVRDVPSGSAAPRK